MKHKNTQLFSWFTLIELIIVVSILAILAIFAFFGLKNYTWYAQDSHRLSTVKNIQKWLDIYQTKVWKYPNPEWEVSQWNINGTILVYKWQIQDTIVQQINMNTVPLDPETQNHYLYGITQDGGEYQIATLLDGQTAYQPLVSHVYAKNYNVKVDGNYKWFLKYTDSCLSYANIPSLLWGNTQNVNLLQTGSTSETPFFIVNQGKNIPYAENNILPDEIIQFLRNTQNANLMTICEEELKNIDTSENKEQITTNFWVSEEEVKTKILWDTTLPTYASCNWTPHWESKDFWSVSNVSPGNTCPLPMNYICEKWIWKNNWETIDVSGLFWVCIVWENNCTLTNNWWWIILSDNGWWCYLF